MIQVESLKRVVTFYLTPLLGPLCSNWCHLFNKNYSTRELGFSSLPCWPVQRESLNSGVRANPRSRRITQQWGSGQSPFKKNHSTVGFGPVPVQEESLNNGVRANRRSRRITEQWGSGQSPFKKNHSTVGFGPIPVQEESLNSGVRANPRSRRIT